MTKLDFIFATFINFFLVGAAIAAMNHHVSVALFLAGTYFIALAFYFRKTTKEN